MRTRHTRISHNKVATHGDAYTRHWIGVPIVFTTWDGERLAGRIDRFQGVYPVAVFPDGRWARLDSHVEIITDPAPDPPEPGRPTGPARGPEGTTVPSMATTAQTPPAPGPSRASALIHNGRGEYLLHLRDYLPGLIVEPGMWSLLGGVREPCDRSLSETIRRELREEAGLDVPALEPFAVETTASYAVQIFTGRWDGSPAALTLTEGVMLHWFAPETMRRLRIAPSTVRLVERHAQALSHP